MTSLLHPNASHVAETLISRGHHGVIVTQPDATLLVSGAHQVNLKATG